MTEKIVRQHVVPKLLLKGFVSDTNPDVLWQYDKTRDNVVQTSPADAAVVKHFYDVPGADPLYVEKLQGRIESGAGVALAKLRSRQTLTLIERVDWALFVAYLSVRTPVSVGGQLDTALTGFKYMMQWLASDPHKFEVTVRRMQDEGRLPPGGDIEEARRQVLVWDIDFKPPRHEFLVGLLEMASGFAKWMASMEWTILMAPRDSYFVCSDNPVYVEDPNRDPVRTGGAGLASSGTVELTCPLAAGVAMLGTWHKGVRLQYLAVRPPIVREVNKRTVLAAQRFVFAPRQDNRIAQLVRKYSDTRPTAIIETVAKDKAGFLMKLSHQTHPVKSIVEMLRS